MKIVVDCNVVISAGITDGICAQVVQDVIYLETAYSGKADIVITGNSKDFPKSFRGIQVMTPRDFLDF